MASTENTPEKKETEKMMRCCSCKGGPAIGIYWDDMGECPDCKDTKLVPYHAHKWVWEKCCECRGDPDYRWSADEPWCRSCQGEGRYEVYVCVK